MKANILVVDDDRFLLEQCVDMLVDVNADIFLATSGKEAMEVLENKRIDVIVLDLVLPDTTGDEVMERAKRKDPNLDVIFMSAFATVESVIKLMRRGIFDYIKKPIVPEEFRFTVLRCLREREIIAENKKLKEYMLLYDLGKMLTSTLELSKVYDSTLILLDNILKDSAIVIFCSDIGAEPDVKGFQGFERADIMRMKDGFSAYIANPRHADAEECIAEDINIYKTAVFSHFLETGFERVMTLPIDNNDGRRGYVFVFCNAVNPDKKEYLHFIKEQINLAIDNSLRYLNAQEMAYIDELTKVYNIRYLYVAMENEIRRAERFGSFVSVLFIDLDHFKSVNDTYGHLVGSRLLIEVASEIKKSVRGIDIVVRYGGDEFVVICTETDVDLAMKVGERIRRRIEEREYFKEEGLSLRMTASIGVSTYPVHSSVKSELIDLADKAMYHGKETSRNIVCLTDRMVRK